MHPGGMGYGYRGGVNGPISTSHPGPFPGYPGSVSTFHPGPISTSHPGGVSTFNRGGPGILSTGHGGVSTVNGWPVRGVAAAHGGSRFGAQHFARRFETPQMRVARAFSVEGRIGRGVGVWGRFHSAADRDNLVALRQGALSSHLAYGTSVRRWYGADGVYRVVTVRFDAPVMMPVVLLPVVAASGMMVGPGAVSAGSAYAGSSYAAGSGGGGDSGLDPNPPTGPDSTAADPGDTGAMTQGQGTDSSADPNAGGDTGGTAQPLNPSQSDDSSGQDAQVTPDPIAQATQRMCRHVTTHAEAGGQTDESTELWCRDDNGDWALAQDASVANGGG
jgi:hypothetical protein